MKKLAIFLCMFLLSFSLYASSFSYVYEGTSTRTISFGSSTTSYLIYFNYNITESLVRPKMVISVNGDLVTNDLCTGNESYLPSTFNLVLSEGVHDVQFALLSVNPNTLSCYDPVIHQVENEIFTIKFQVRIQNNFDGGEIYVDDMVTPKNAPYNKTASNGVSIPVKAKPQFADNYQRIWNQNGTNNSDWQYKQSIGSFQFFDDNIQTSYNVQSNDKNTIVQANLRKVCNVDFQNQFSGTSAGGEMYINGSWKNAPSTEVVVEQNQISVTAKQSYIINGIVYDFEKWTDNISARSRNIYPSGHGTYTAKYKGTPTFDGLMRNLIISGTGGINNYVKLTWSDHPNDYVTQYHIYRYYKRPDGTVSTPVHIATRNRGTLTYTDIEYKYNPSGGDYILYYDVKAYYSLEGTISPAAYVSTKGDQSGTASKIGLGEGITYYDIANYPNPYNPQTTIRFQLPQEGFVTIKVYNALGEEIKTLLNEEKEYGMYELKFDGSDLPSGMYIYTIKVNEYYASKKMLLVK
ncbi:MAG: T9SS C-terminal target domain-containing protein [Ignavibacteriales bacterium]|nr:MAG: T9SS C-terminal target domain-containing protein [Ignavibacteriales bacterium]